MGLCVISSAVVHGSGETAGLAFCWVFFLGTGTGDNTVSIVFPIHQFSFDLVRFFKTKSHSIIFLFRPFFVFQNFNTFLKKFLSFFFLNP